MRFAHHAELVACTALLGGFTVHSANRSRHLATYATDVESIVAALSTEDRRRFLDWLYEHEDELFGPDDIHPEVQAEILRRREEALAHPEKLEDWESAFPRMKQRFDELRGKNPYAR